MELSKWVVSAVFVANLLCLATSDTTPVFLWTNQGSLPDVRTPVGHHLSSADFNKKVITHLAKSAKGNLIAFLHDKLSLDDITKYADVYNEKSTGNVFKNLKNAIEDHDSLEIPSVHDSGVAVQNLANNFKGKVHYLSAPYDIKTLPLDDKQRHMIMVHLPSDSQAHKESLKQNDEVLGRVSEELKKLGKPFSALYTGQESSKIPAESLYMGRHLLATASTNQGVPTRFFNYSGCSYLYLTGLEVSLLEITSELNKKTVTRTVFYRQFVSNEVKLLYPAGDYCKNASTTLVIKSEDGADFSNFKIQMIANSSYPFEWRINNLQLGIKINNGSVQYDDTKEMRGENLKAEKGFSYHCSDPAIFTAINATVVSSTDKITVQQLITLKFRGFQLQVSPSVLDGKFGPPDDCVGFFTIPIWSGIIMAIVLASVLAFGIVMIMNISTMDRFDDPKGKPLIINVAE